MGDILQTLADVGSSIGDLINETNMEIIKNSLLSVSSGVISGIAAASEDLKIVWGENKTVQHGTMLTLCLITSAYMTESPLFTAASIVPYAISYYLSGRRNVSTENHDTHEDEINILKRNKRNDYEN
ncbi:hypothetical protein ACFLZB_04115 [Nanoarchaeota archaeon]